MVEYECIKKGDHHMENKCNYPMEIFSSIRRTREGVITTFASECHFARETEEFPLVPPRYSRLTLALFTKNRKDGDVNLRANVWEGEIDGIIRKTDACRIRFMAGGTKSAQVPLKGKMAGKTPAEFLLDGGSEQELLAQREWLASNLQRYPSNQAGINAIDEAIRYARAGKLSQMPKATATIFKTDMRFVGHPDQEGFQTVYAVKADYSFVTGGVKLYIRNFRAIVDTMPDRTKRIKASSAKDKRQLSFDFTASEWDTFTWAMRNALDSFNRMAFPRQWSVASDIDRTRREAHASGLKA